MRHQEAVLVIRKLAAYQPNQQFDKYTVDAWAGDLVAKAYSITDGMNLLTVTSGRMPESPDECIVDKNLLEKMFKQSTDYVK